MPSVTQLNSKHNKFKYRDLLDLNYVETGKRHKAFTEKVAKELIESKEVFCVAFDFAWKWLGYTDRVAAKGGLFPTRNLKPNIDFIIVDPSTRTVWIDVKNLKEWAVIADTEKSREVLACLDRVEKFALSIVPTPIATPTPTPTPAPAISPVLVASNDLQRFDKDGIELVINTRTGEAFATQSGYARMSGLSRQAINKRCKGCNLDDLKTAEIETPSGLQGCNLIPAKLVFKWAITDKPELAEAMGEAGATVYIHQLAGFKVTSDAVKKPTPTPPTAISPVLVASNDLQRFDKDGIELVIDTRTGEAFATQSGYARMSGLSRQAINKRCKGCNLDDLKTAEIETPSGLQGCNLIPAKLVFKWAITDKPELAEAMGEAGATVYIHQLAGFKVTSDAVKKPTPTPTPTPPISLLPGDIRLVQMVSSLKDINFELLNPRFKQGLQDLAADMLGISTPLLPANARDGVWCGVVERAEQLNYPIELTLNKRNVLGRWVSALISDRVKEVRLCNGTQRQINLYRITPELDTAIVAYFDKINIKPLS